MQLPVLSSPERRQRAVAFAVALATGTALAPEPYERALLELYAAGTLTLEEVSEVLERSVYQVLYHSCTRAAPSDDQLQELLRQSRAYNAQHGITGLLLYSDGHYVQVLEGPQSAVQALYARIQQDPRHEQVVTVSAGPGPQRQFAEWSMGFGRVVQSGVEQGLDGQQTAEPSALHGDQTRLQALLAAFGHPAAGPLVQRQLHLAPTP
jgi:hypothetical protein